MKAKSGLTRRRTIRSWESEQNQEKHVAQRLTNYNIEKMAR